MVAAAPLSMDVGVLVAHGARDFNKKVPRDLSLPFAPPFHCLSQAFH